MSSIKNPLSSIFYCPAFWIRLHGKSVAITYCDGTVLLGTAKFKKEEFPMITEATISKPGMSERWLGTTIIDMSQVKKVEVQE